MNNHNLVPLAEVGPSEEANPGTFGSIIPVRELPSLKNYATDEKIKLFCQEELYSIMEWTRTDRQGLDAEWAQIREMNQMVHGAGRRYFGRSDAYMPIYRKIRHTNVSALSLALFPTEDYFDCVDRRSNDPESAKPVKLYMQWELEVNGRIKSIIKPTLAQMYDYGTTVLKYVYRKDLMNIGKAKRRNGKGLNGRDLVSYGFERKCVQDGLSLSPRNLMDWYIYPSTSQSILDAQMIFEDLDVPNSYVESMAALGRWDNVEECIRLFSNPEHFRKQQEMLWARGSMQVPGQAELPKSAMIYTISEVWTFMVLPKEAYMQGEDTNEPLPVRVVMCGHIPLEVRRNPYFHQRPPYAVGRTEWEPGMFYGTGGGRTILPLQLLGNDFMNQTNDNGIYAMNPIPLVNVGLMAQMPAGIAPGVPWYVHDVDKAVKFDRPPWEQVQVGLQMFNQIMNAAMDAGGAPPVLQGTQGAKTATSTSILQRNALGPIQDQAQDVEQDIMIPLLEGAFSNALQYREEEVFVAVAGQQLNINPEQLAVDAQFQWMGSIQAANAQVRNQQAISLIQAAMPLMPVLMQQGYVVDFTAVLKRLWAGFGYRGFHEFVRKAEAVPGAMPGQPIRPDQQPGVQMEQGDRMRSALEQVYGQGDPMAEAQPGEADDFGAVRSDADQMAALFGPMGGGGGFQ